ncbi:Sensor histidine kinase RcsC [Paraburkholderia kirstenboschensis]|uniref:response regulator n=1 Tax=Paraburkholderia kirstenboschensis TaxID=1245436 RepID=UPI000B2F6A86|nr:response regulator [Paraburkholderia kirstenboschensis]CAD6557894.1 Sensor histidine kinase RcsC [Paraburkholderia kirstenboschensis]
MQKILDRTQESLGQAFASLAKTAKRQQRVYLATIGSLMLMVAVFALVIAVVAAFKQLEYRRTFTSQNATDLSLLLHREESFLRRAEFTLDYYYGATDVRRAPEAVEQSIAQTGAARGKVDRVDAEFDIVIGQSARAAWGTQLGDKLGRLYESAQSTLVTQQAFELEQRATLIGVDEDYAVILPSLPGSATGPNSGAARSATSAQQAALAGVLRETIERELQSQTGKRVPGKGERLWVGPYRDPLQNTPVISAVSAYYEGDKPVTLISASIPLTVLAARIAPPGSAGATLLMAPDRRILVSSAALDAQTGAMLQHAVATTPPHVFHYDREGAIFYEPLMPGFGSLVGYVPWGGLAAALGWQLAVIGSLALVVMLAIALTARLFGLRLLRNAFAETSHALESDTLNHILVSATPIGLCIVRRSDYSILTANALATELLQIEPGTRRLPPHIAAEFLAQAPEQASAAAFARIAAFVAPAQPPSQPAAPMPANAQAAAAPESGAAPAQFLQFTYAPARYAGDNVLFCAILDVTAQHALEQQLRHAQQASEAMMRARTNFFAAMSHEIRTPLNALLGNLELFARTPGLEVHAQRLAALNVAGDALRRVVNDILDFSKIDAGEMLLVREPFPLLDTFESIALSYAAMAGDRPIRFYSLPSPALDRTVVGDRMRIAQVINNLLSNAFKFTSSGKIMLQADLIDDAQGRPVLNCRVSDSGPGMSQELVTRLFKPFVQGEAGASRGAESTGLGLVICARLCQLMGGTISAESVVGVGSVFNVSIPLAAPPDEKPAPVVEKRGMLLALCQDSQVAALLGRWLEHFGWSAHVVPALAGARAWLQANRPKALIVSGAYDLDVIASLRALQPVPAVWVTRAGPRLPQTRGDGVFEVTEFSGTAVRAAIELAIDGTPVAAASEVPATPARAGSTTASAAVPLLTTLPALQGLTILVAEDNPLIQTLIAEQLATLGCAPSIAGDGKQALGLFERTRFDVVLTDIHMPAMDGYEFLAALRKLDADVPVLAFSAVAENQEAQSWHEQGFSGYVSKPASLGELQASLLAVAPAAQERAAPAAAPASVVPTEAALAADEKARYTAMLKEHLKNDLPRLLAIVDEEDRQALAGWAHSASGAFVIVQEPRFVEECRQLQRLCNDSESWTTEMDERAVSLHEALCDHYGVDEASTH